MTRVGGGGLSRNPFGQVGARPRPGQTETPTSLQGQLERELFGKKPPRTVDADSAETEAILAWLVAWTKKLARFAGDADDAYRVRLAADTIAMIDGDGTIFMGLPFVTLHHETNPDLVIGVLAHEVGHRPKRWAQYRQTQPTTADEVARLSRLEETRADHFAGRALATFDRSIEPMCAFLLRLEAPTKAGMHGYFPAAIRCEVIREGHVDGQRQDALKQSMFPELAKLSGKHDLGMG